MKKIRNTLVVALPALLLLAAPASSYSKFEHEQLTFYAFEVARQLVCEVERPPAACSGFGRASSAELGKVTRAVDYFSHPWRLVPRPEHCTDSELAKDDEHGCRKSLADKCQFPKPPVMGSRQKRKACLDSILEDTLARVHKRRNKKLWRLIAVHRNDEHFRQGAEDQYNRMHGRALEMAAESEYALALVAEAVAIHFLQDAFAPGHLAAPRDQYGDSYAGSLHDRFNSEGLPIWIDSDLCAAAEELLEPWSALNGEDADAAAEERLKIYLGQVNTKQQAALEEVDPTPKPKAKPKKIEAPAEIKESKQIEPAALKKDLEKFVEELCGSAPPSPAYKAFGDKRLLTGRSGSSRAVTPGSDPSRHRASLLALAVESIRDVLEARQSRKPPLHLCFHPPSVGEPPEVGCGEGTDQRFWAPGLAVGRAYAGFSDEKVCWPCSQDDLLFGFQTEPDRGRYSKLVGGAHRVNGLQVAFSYVGEKRRRFEFAHDLAASEQYYERDEDGSLVNKVGRRAFGSLGYSLHYEKDNDLEASAAGILYSYGIQYEDFDFYAALEPGIGYYSFPGGNSTRYRWSVRAGVGWSVVAGEVIVERGYELLPGGRLEKEWRPSVNLRLRVAPSWISMLVKR